MANSRGGISLRELLSCLHYQVCVVRVSKYLSRHFQDFWKSSQNEKFLKIIEKAVLGKTLVLEENEEIFHDVKI